jgi:RNA polymerase sigma factor (sigma-70 family)
MFDGTPTAEERFRDLFEAHHRSLLGYALRRSATSSDAAEVLADSMLIAWRRLGDVPEGDEAKLWLFGVARRVLANQSRGDQRRDRLAERLGVLVGRAVAECHAEVVVVQNAVGKAIDRLDEDEQELVRLAYWEGLTPSEIAIVLGIPAATARTRLHRTRTKLRTTMISDGSMERSALAGHVAAEGISPLSPNQEDK